MRNRNYGRMLLTGLVVGVCGLCWVQNVNAQWREAMTTNHYYEDYVLGGSGFSGKTGVLIDAVNITVTADWLECQQLYVYKGGVLRTTGRIEFNTTVPDDIWTWAKASASDNLNKIVVGGANNTWYKYVYDNNTYDCDVSGDGTLIANGTVKTENLIVNENGKFISSGTGESTVGNLSGTGNVRFYVDSGKVGQLTVTDSAAGFIGSVYVGLNGVANIANFQPQDVLSSNVHNKTPDRILTSSFFECALNTNEDYYRISLNDTALADIDTYTVNGTTMDLGRAMTGVLNIVPPAVGGNYVLELTVGMDNDTAAVFENFMSSNETWKVTQLPTAADSAEAQYLLTALFHSSMENLLAWDFSGSGYIANIGAVSISGHEVPEPSSLALILCGLVGGYVVWRRNRMAAKASA